MGKIIAIANQKGGVGKTTTALNLADILSQKGKRVLAVDLDPQSNLTMCCGVDKPESLEASIYHMMEAVLEEKEPPDIEEVIKKYRKIDFIPCSIELSAMEVSLVNSMSREMTLKTILEPLQKTYDYILIDCMPSLGMLTINALAACDSVLIPATPQYLSAKGLEMLLRTIGRIKKRINPRITIDGILLNQYTDRVRLARDVLSMIEDAYGGHLRIFTSRIPVSVKVGESMMNGMSISAHDPGGKVAKAYRDFTEEFLNG